MVKHIQIQFQTDTHHRMVDITTRVEEALDQSGMCEGMVLIFVIGSTGALSTIEYEPGLQSDFPELMQKLIPEELDYQHNKTWGDGNGHSHLRATLLGPSLTVPVVDGKLVLGTWQQIVFLEFDNRSRSRRLLVQFLGETQ
ncbi:MAG TPA: YjbQ family protein [Candidatus Aminicenantes bacterium]|nr:YjbQ family protein [Candidatus Aminicenantes bacterium]